MDRPLTGLKVLDFSTTIAGPHCARMLADLGADVVKIEPPEGDMMRTRMPLRQGASTSFGQLNAGKRSIVLDLKRPAAVDAARRLAAGADVLVENYRPGVMARLGLDHPALSTINERLVYCAISGYGQTGPSAHRAAYAPVIHAASGFDLAHLAHQTDRTVPDNSGIFIADVLAGTYAFGAIMTALRQRDATGKGQMIDVSMLEAMLSLTLTEMQAAQFAMPPPPRRPLFGPVATSDGFVIIAIASERTFQALAEAAGADWAADPRFATYGERRANWSNFMDEVEAWSRQMRTEKCLAVLERHGVPASAYRTVREAMADPQLQHRDAFVEIGDAGGTFMALKPPFRFSNASIAAGPRAASLGEHTESVLVEAGFLPDEIAAVRRR
jgi:crotonobetainyl-CoA:carnitine CoA-transferase CaiB-like acyl-CoA transferase